MNGRVKLGKLSRRETPIYLAKIFLCQAGAMTTPDENTPGKPTLLAIALGLLAFGLVMLSQGLGLHDGAWLRPNPRTPQWVFGSIGLILILASILTASKLRALPAPIFNTVGYATLGLSWIMAHWLIFFSEGGSCEANSGGLLLNLPALACRGVLGAATIVFDLILLIILYTTLRPPRRR